MDADKLNEAADIASNNAVYDSNPWNMFNDGFRQGAQWLMTLPLYDRLTDEEKEKIKERYNYYLSEEPNCYLGCRMRNEFESIFGKKLFNEK
ncbi:MAG: hypothetical protein K2K08_05670 [Paramuribaculum sp.]|nr:hypothetical protein [Paramuribaculum sp.]